MLENQVEPKKAIVMADEAEANKSAAAAKVIKDECEAALAVAMPVLNEALAALDTLSANDINYVKKLANPPYLIKLVLEAVCVILDVKPAKVPDGKGGQIMDYWKPSVVLLNDKNFLQNLKVIQPLKISSTVAALVMVLISVGRCVVWLTLGSPVVPPSCRKIVCYPSYTCHVLIVHPPPSAAASIVGNRGEPKIHNSWQYCIVNVYKGIFDTWNFFHTSISPHVN